LLLLALKGNRKVLETIRSRATNNFQLKLADNQKFNPENLKKLLEFTSRNNILNISKLVFAEKL
jgi:hypothetical protein